MSQYAISYTQILMCGVAHAQWITFPDPTYTPSRVGVGSGTETNGGVSAQLYINGRPESAVPTKMLTVQRVCKAENLCVSLVAFFSGITVAYFTIYYSGFKTGAGGGCPDKEQFLLSNPPPILNDGPKSEGGMDNCTVESVVTNTALYN